MTAATEEQPPAARPQTATGDWWQRHWLRHYRRDYLAGDLSAAIITTLLLVPQGVAYALLAGMPPEAGLFAGILPPIAYALLGSSNTMSVGPMAVTSLMTAAALAPHIASGTPLYVLGAAWVALVGGIGLLLAGLVRFGFLAQLLSRPVLSGFTTSAAVLIAWSQLPGLLGIQVATGAWHWRALLHGDAAALLAAVHWIPATAVMGLIALAALWLGQQKLAGWLVHIGLRAGWAQLIARLSPALIVILASVATALWQLDADAGVKVVGMLNPHLPTLDFNGLNARLLTALVPPALMIALVNFVSSVSIAQSLAAMRDERIDADAELRGLGAANIAAGLFGGLPVNGGLSRSAVNFAAGARTPLAAVLCALLMVAVVLIGGGWFTHMPVTVLAGTIIVALLGLIDIKTLRQAWRYDRTDAAAWLVTAGGVLVLGVVEGIALGVATAVISLLWRGSHPHIAVLGRLPGTEHFRNVERYKVECLPHTLICRIDENLFFGNIQAVDRRLREEVDRRADTQRLLLVMSSVSQIDMTALQALLQLNRELGWRGITLHLSEVKGPVMDRLRQTPLLGELSGRVFVSTFAAYTAFDGETQPEYAI